MEIQKQWIVTTSLSENNNEFAILYLTKNGNYFLSYTVFQMETELIKITQKEAIYLINKDYSAFDSREDFILLNK